MGKPVEAFNKREARRYYRLNINQGLMVLMTVGDGGWWEEHLIHQREFKTVSTHNHEGEGLAGSPVVSSTPEISPLHQYRVLLYPV